MWVKSQPMAGLGAVKKGRGLQKPVVKRVVKSKVAAINIIAAISWPPPLISHPLFHRLAVFAWILLACSMPK